MSGCDTSRDSPVRIVDQLVPSLNEPLPLINGPVLEEAFTNGKSKNEFTQGEIAKSTRNEVDTIDTTADNRSLLETPNLHPRSSAMTSTANLDLASTAKSSLVLLGVCSLMPSKGSLMEPSVYDAQQRDGRRLPTGATAADTNLVRDSSPLCSSLPLPSPCATTDNNTGSAKPNTVTSGGKKRRIKFITATRQPDVGDIESPPALKKRWITLKTRLRTPGKKKHSTYPI
jgi:hypothetical protein